MIQFLTGNKSKFEEVQSILPNIEQMDIDLPEIQEVDARQIIEAKLREAFKHAQGEFIVEDTSLHLEALNGLPGTFIKWFQQGMGNDGLVNLTEKMGNNKAVAKTIIGYAKNKDEIRYFEGAMYGIIVRPQGASGFGWDPIFKPDGYEQTFAEVSMEDKNKISARSIATSQLKEFLRA